MSIPFSTHLIVNFIGSILVINIDKYVFCDLYLCQSISATTSIPSTSSTTETKSNVPIKPTRNSQGILKKIKLFRIILSINQLNYLISYFNVKFILSSLKNAERHVPHIDDATTLKMKNKQLRG